MSVNAIFGWRACVVRCTRRPFSARGDRTSRPASVRIVFERELGGTAKGLGLRERFAERLQVPVMVLSSRWRKPIRDGSTFRGRGAVAPGHLSDVGEWCPHGAPDSLALADPAGQRVRRTGVSHGTVIG